MNHELTTLHGNTYGKVRETLLTAKNKVYAAVNFAMVEAYWEIGKEIAEAIGERAEYGKGLLTYLSKELTAEFGSGFTVRNLQAMRPFSQSLIRCPMPYSPGGFSAMKFAALTAPTAKISRLAALWRISMTSSCPAKTTS